MADKSLRKEVQLKEVNKNIAWFECLKKSSREELEIINAKRIMIYKQIKHINYNLGLCYDRRDALESIIKMEDEHDRNQ